MNIRNVVMFASAVVGFAIAFFLYGVGRTMRETVTFTASGFLSGMLLSFVLPLAFVVLALFASRDARAAAKVSVLIAAFLLAGSVASELSILRDEHHFAIEASKSKSIYSRPRAWPNRTASLVYVPGKGIHSTD